MEMDSENTGGGYFAQHMAIQEQKINALSQQINFLVQAQEKTEERNSRMEIDEDYIPEKPLDIIALVHEKYGSLADSYLNMIHPLNPGIFEPSEQSVAVFGKNLQSIFGYLPKVFPSDREKITFLYSKSPENYQRQIRELVKIPGPQRTFKTVFEQTFLNEREKSWFHPIPKYLAKGARGELDVDETHKWLDDLDMDTIKKVVVFTFHSNYFRNELLKHNYEHGNHAAAVTTVNNQVRYNKVQRSEKSFRPKFRPSKFTPKKNGDNHADKPKPKQKSNE
ncbi:hypothetical protein SPOG_05005 [Schizosaccharomyces cryophilus OY26]|uniref:Uncharacterized protein n=1 Tax=Schizosaccharomyces cryophilus (strain OY26 / ATCC MYA-4695 / CBS 11777 / NBRC 106824 / NRRL Y48691) TaxID=653667 RepID=S9X5S8_SCHCR|nr:uncharacterized protein SPOG_05005 [Schizosaccharomyces cryophilus OY26]EPY49151.1 hypothetical protein SPOG_05005 [Schizosaccharomyces cryophilus OY26]